MNSNTTQSNSSASSTSMSPPPARQRLLSMDSILKNDTTIDMRFHTNTCIGLKTRRGWCIYIMSLELIGCLSGSQAEITGTKNYISAQDRAFLLIIHQIKSKSETNHLLADVFGHMQQSFHYKLYYWTSFQTDLGAFIHVPH